MGDRKFVTKYGYFTKDDKEYVITGPYTPRPWVNVISNGEYSLVISQTGGGFSWLKDSNLNAITTWREDLIKDEFGKFIYIRDNDSGIFWSAGFKPVCKNPQKYECHHGIGSTVINSKNDDIESKLLIFIPPDEPLEVWKLIIKNTSQANRSLSLFTYLEWCLGVSPDTHREFHKTFMETKFDKNLNTIFAFNRLWEIRNKKGQARNSNWNYVAFHSANIKPISFEGDKEKFLGMYRSEQNPQALEKGKLTNTDGKWSDSIASLQIDMELNPTEERTVIFTLGATTNKDAAMKLIRKYKDVHTVDLAFEDMRKFWDTYLNSVQVNTPDDTFNILTNTWFKYQAISGRLWARTAYYQQAGGFGFRDQLQDSQVFLPINPDMTKRQLLLHARQQFMDGTVYHWWHELTQEGLPTRMTDDLLWLPYVTINYLKETSDFSILEEKIRYVDSNDMDTLYTHCCKAINMALERFSPRGLPLIGEGDWNDGMNGIGCDMKGESIWLGHFLYWILNEFSFIAKKQGEKPLAEKYERRAKELKEKINELAWDGNWYIRATKDDGTELGSHKCKEGKIFLNAQTWSVISGTATDERAKIAMNSVEQLLDKDYGPLLFSPAYSYPNENIGYLSRYAPGARENGGVYTHAAVWAILAECILGRGNKAYQMYSKICPIKRGMNPDQYFCEPYVMPGDSHGPDSPHFGRGEWTWYTGSAAWLFRVATEWILGIRPTHDGLFIDPCIPKEWKRCNIKRPFRGAIYEIEIENLSGIEKGVKKIFVDGKQQNLRVIKPHSDRKVHKIKVIMGI